MIIEKYLVFFAVLFTIANTQKQPKCPLAGERIKKMCVCVCVCVCVYGTSVIKKNEIVPFAAT